MKPSPLQIEVRNIAMVIAAIALVAGVALFAVGTILAELSPSHAMLFAIGMILPVFPKGFCPR